MAAEREEMRGIDELIESVVDGMIAPAGNSPIDQSGPAIPCGLPDVDRCLNGLWPGDLTAVLSAPSVGRSSFAYQAALSAALEGVQVELFALEEKAEMAAARMASGMARVPLGKMFSGHASEGDRAALSDYSKKVAEADLRICGNHRMSLDGLCGVVEAGRAGGGKRLVVIDGAERLLAGGERAGLDAVAKRLKLLARDTDAHVLVTVGVNGRAARRIRRKKCQIGAILDLAPDVAAVADVVLMLDRSLDIGEADLLRNSPPMGTAELTIAKNRRGWQRSFTLAFIADFGRFMAYASV